MNSVEAGPLRASTAPAGPASGGTAPRAGKTGPSRSAPDAEPSPAPSATAAPPAPLAEPPVLSLAALLDQARAAQAELAGQPLSITSHNRFIMNLFGG